MASKLFLSIVLLGFVSVSLAGYAGQYLPHQDYYAYPKYQYSYGVNDYQHGDVKSASEVRDGDLVKGQYSLREPDGAWRHVSYVADKGGFRANVHRTPGAHPVGHVGHVGHSVGHSAYAPVHQVLH